MYPCMTKKGCPEAVLKPGTSGFCPLWRETNFIETNPQTQESRALRGCYYDVSIQMIEHCVRSTNRPAAEIHQMREDVINGLTGGLELVFKTLQEQKETRLISS